MDLAHRALRVIEALTFEEVANSPEEKLEQIYKFAHVGLGICKADHGPWFEEFSEAEKALIEMGIIGPQDGDGDKEKDNGPDDRTERIKIALTGPNDQTQGR